MALFRDDIIGKETRTLGEDDKFVKVKSIDFKRNPIYYMRVRSREKEGGGK